MRKCERKVAPAIRCLRSDGSPTRRSLRVFGGICGFDLATAICHRLQQSSESRCHRERSCVGSSDTPETLCVARSWRADETYIKVTGSWMFLYQAVDAHGRTVASYLSRTRDQTAARIFFRQAIKHHGEPRSITPDDETECMTSVCTTAAPNPVYPRLHYRDHPRNHRIRDMTGVGLSGQMLLVRQPSQAPPKPGGCSITDHDPCDQACAMHDRICKRRATFGVI